MTNTPKFEKYKIATLQAQEILKSKGVIYPLPDRNLSTQENYDRISAYAQQESALVVQLLNQDATTSPKPTPEPPKKSWRDWND